jgi:predicted RNA-binding protein YlqC (UPF0109 family)
MEELLKYILQTITQYPDEISITSSKSSYGQTIFYVSLNQEDKWIVIGKAGKNIQAIRNLLNILAKREGDKVSIKITDDEQSLS